MEAGREQPLDWQKELRLDQGKEAERAMQILMVLEKVKCLVFALVKETEQEK